VNLLPDKLRIITFLGIAAQTVDECKFSGRLLGIDGEKTISGEINIIRIF